MKAGHGFCGECERQSYKILMRVSVHLQIRGRTHEQIYGYRSSQFYLFAYVVHCINVIVVDRDRSHSIVVAAAVTGLFPDVLEFVQESPGVEMLLILISEVDGSHVEDNRILIPNYFIKDPDRLAVPDSKCILELFWRYLAERSY
jgi:hypothetical protein